MYIREYTDVIIIGGGISGYYTALNLNSNLNVVIVNKKDVEDSNSILAQGGIAACVNEKDDFYTHIQDTLIAGAGINDEMALRTLVYEAPRNIEKLIELGVDFDRDESGKLKRTMEGGHSKRRILHGGGDATGREVIKALKEQINDRKNIVVWEDCMAIDLIKKDKRCLGVILVKEDKVINLFSKSIVIATGGIGAIYKHSTNPSIATGDGIAMAYRIGCAIKDMEFIQFHPTALYTKNEGRKFLISEAVRGEGAYLRNKYGERFMLGIDPRAELAPRDIVARSIFREMEKTKSDHVYLDITHKDRLFLQNRFPTIYKHCFEHGIDMSKDLIPVVPVEHYLIGGIRTDINGRTNITNLYACGECANTGVHGANRLASNSLLECLVFGRRIAEDINNNIEGNSIESVEGLDHIQLKDFTTSRKLAEERYLIKETMDKYVGIIRSNQGLVKAKGIIEEVLDRLNKQHIINRDYIETKNMAVVAKIVIECCLQRKESIGCHYIV